MKEQFCFGVVDGGCWRPDFLRSFRALPDCTLGFIYDISADRLRPLKGLDPGVETETKYDKLLGGPGLDAILIAHHGQVSLPARPQAHFY